MDMCAYVAYITENHPGISDGNMRTVRIWCMACYLRGQQIQGGAINLCMSALERIDKECSFPADEVQRACRDVARDTIEQVHKLQQLGDRNDD